MQALGLFIGCRLFLNGIHAFAALRLFLWAKPRGVAILRVKVKLQQPKNKETFVGKPRQACAEGKNNYIISNS